jgi:GTP-binding protein Era
MSTRTTTHRAGFVALLGPPNAGKSTLLNRLLGEKLAIVTARPQTTRSRILGIVNRPGAQILLVDTPGLHESSKQLNVALNESVAEAAKECDVAVVLIDANRSWETAHDRLMSGLRARGVPVLVALNKIDLVADPASVLETAQASAAASVLAISAQTGEGIVELLRQIEAALPESPALYPEDALTDRPVRWLCGELIREAAFECLEQELPYSLAVEILEFDERRSDLIKIHANLLVARESQKRIVIGAGGRTIKGIGMRARQNIQRLVDNRVHLEIFVKVDPNWLKSARRFEELGYR